jgi:hypothetical protein
MNTFKWLKFFFIPCFITTLSCQATTNSISIIDKTINQLYHNVLSKPNTDIATRVTTISHLFLGKPYVLGALGEGEKAYYDSAPLYRLDAFDCETYVDTVLALTLANNLPQFKQRIRQIRYKNGVVSYLTRNHFTSLDWNKNNEAQGFIKDVTTSIHDKMNKPIAHMAHALIDKPNWYQHRPLTTIRINNITTAEQQLRLNKLKEKGQNLPVTRATIAYLPLSSLFDNKGEANLYLFKQIPNASIIEIVRPNWDLVKLIGTHLNVSHLGLAIWQDGVLMFREASSIEGRVVDVPLIDYLREAKKSPTIKGINIHVILPQESMP